jgi:type IV pilus assembly protein PilM
MFRKKLNLIGLDIGSHAIKMLRLKEKNGRLSLLNAGLLPISPENLHETKAGRQDRLAKGVQSLSSHLKTKDKCLAMSISGYDVMIKKIELPAMTEEELEDRMHLELGQYIPYSIDEVEVDYQILDVAKDRPNFMEVLLVAAKKESINDSVELARLAGFEPMVIDVDFFALCNAYEATYGLTDKETIALLDIGANKAAINVLHRGAPIFPRDIPIGGEQINDAIRENFKVADQEAERIKLGEASSRVSGPALEQTVADVVGNWLSEIKRTIDFYTRNYPENKIDKIYLSGGSARISGLIRVLQENTGIPVEVFNPLLRVDYDQKVFDPAYLEYIGPQMCVAFGLALRKSVEK